MLVADPEIGVVGKVPKTKLTTHFLLTKHMLFYDHGLAQKKCPPSMDVKIISKPLAWALGY